MHKWLMKDWHVVGKTFTNSIPVLTTLNLIAIRKQFCVDVK